MADIQSIKWGLADHDRVLIALTDGRSVAGTWPDNRTHWREKIQDWLDGGGVIAAEDPPPAVPSSGEIYDRQLRSQRLLKAVVMALADGSIVAGGKQSPEQLKAAVVAKM